MNNSQLKCKGNLIVIETAPDEVPSKWFALIAPFHGEINLTSPEIDNPPGYLMHYWISNPHGYLVHAWIRNALLD